MAASKKHTFLKEEIEIANIAKALSHPARIAIIRILLNKDCICKEIVEELPLAQSTVSQHLKELKNLGLIIGDIDYPKICYRVDRNKWQQIQNDLITLFKSCC